MTPEDVVVQLGGTATREQLLQTCTPREIRAAVTTGRLLRLARGRYGSTATGDAELARAELSGTLSCLSAAIHHGWEVAREPDRPWVAVPRNRKVRVPTGHVHLTYAHVRGLATSPVDTVIECARRLPFGEALAVADSALRHGLSPDELAGRASAVRGKGSGRARRIAREASHLAANPLESMLRAIALDLGLAVRPQVPVELPERTIWPDLVDSGRRLVIEAEGFAYHGTSLQFSQDVWRYTSLTARGWTVLRFTYRHVMQQPEWVADTLRLYLRTCTPA
jgi:very-short-patch-repair endonuclease